MILRRLTDTAILSAGIVAGVGLLAGLTIAGWLLNRKER